MPAVISSPAPSPRDTVREQIARVLSSPLTDGEAIDRIVKLLDITVDRRAFCSHCGAEMTAGYVIHDGAAHYCCDAHLHAHITPGQYSEMYEADEAYYTEWE